MAQRNQKSRQCGITKAAQADADLTRDQPQHDPSNEPATSPTASSNHRS
jgi:hypothetical protein